MLLVIDVGNTNTVLGVYEGSTLLAHWRLTTAPTRTVDEYGILCRELFAAGELDMKAIDAIAIASVVPPMNFTLHKMSINYFHREPLFVDPATNSGMKIAYHLPQDVGADRIVNAVAAFTRYGGPAVVVDFGTATTFDAIGKEGEYLGGVICPGITASSEALFERAARLPRVQFKRTEKVIGTTTVNSIQAGFYWGYVGLVEGILTRMIEELGGSARVIATGGLAGLIATGTELIERVDSDLTLDGLRLIYERNQRRR